MLRRTLLLVAFLIPTLTRAADTANVPWLDAPVAAVAAAQTQQKMLLVYSRAECAKCNNACDAMFAKAATDDVFISALDAFVPLRVDSTTAPHPIVDSLRKERRRGPLVAIYDTDGVQLALLDGDDLRWDKVGELLLRFRSARPFVVVAADFRRRGNDGTAAFALGHALMSAREPGRAAEQFEIAATSAKRADDRQSSQIMAGYARFASGQQKRGRAEVLKVLRGAVSNAVAAEANFRVGAMAEAELRSRMTVTNAPIATPTTVGSRQPMTEPIGHSSVVVTNEDALRTAVASYRKAYELAAPGSETLDAVRRALARIDDRPLPSKEGMPSTLRLIAPPRPALTGLAEFVAEAGPGVARVDFFLDEQQVASLKKAPFRATIDVGPTARARRVGARAFDASGRPISDAVVAINERLDAFVITFVAPVSEVLRGAASVELDVRMPPGRKLQNVELSWNGKPLATLTQAPFRSRVEGTGELGYLRAVGILDDGTTTEATKVFNSGPSASMEVAVVTLIASVADRAGDTIRGLSSHDFVVQDEGKTVDAELRSAEDDPVTIGIAIDSSSSMAGQQLYVIGAAAEFVRRALRPNDEAYVVSFDTGARLVHARSSDVAALRGSILGLVPGGGTSIFDGVTFALQQMQGIPGKRALIVFSDGREGTSSASATECGRLARALGVPVYVIVPPGGEKMANALADIAEATGGLLFPGTPAERLGELFDGLANEVRGQYVLSFTRPAGTRSGEWRAVRVYIRDREAKVRAIQGYRAD